MNILAAGLFGALFGVGLILSGMTDPAKVTAFLDVAGAWDPSLAFVMGGAVLTAAPIFYLTRGRQKPLLAATFEPPQKTALDARLIAGSAVFGVGWGLSGLCPGPAIVSLGLSPAAAAPFAVAMIVGLAAAGGLERLLPDPARAPA